MKILVVCDQGNNRSVTIAHHLKYWGHDVLSCATAMNSANTLRMLANWAERVIITESRQLPVLEHQGIESAKIQLWDVGPDVYPRPFNKQLLVKVRRLMEEHKPEYKLD